MITEVFYYIDEFCKVFEKETDKKLLGKQRKRRRKSNLSLSEIMTICSWFHTSGYKTFKDYYLRCVIHGELKNCFSHAVSYTRFFELKRDATLPLAFLAQALNSADCTGASFIDSFPLNVCHIKRCYSHKVFKGAAHKEKTSVVWFFGFKLHVVINHKEKILSFCITPGNIADSNWEVILKGSIIGAGWQKEFLQTILLSMQETKTEKKKMGN